MQRRLFLLIAAVMLLAACGPSEPVVIPTVVVLSSPVPSATPIPTESGPATLPPTWTPGVPATPTPEVLDVVPTAESAGPTDRLLFVADGVLYGVNVDGSGFDTLTNAANVRDVALSPSGTRIAFVAAGSGSGSEVYVLDLASGEQRQVSALGFADVVDPAWSPDGGQIVFAAGPFADGEREVYMVSANGQGIQQITTVAADVLAATSDPSGQSGGSTLTAVGLSDPVFTPDGASLFFAAPGLVRFDLTSGAQTLLTIPSGWGNDTDPAWRPGTPEVLYIASTEGQTGQPGGDLRVVEMSTFTTAVVPPSVVNFPVTGFAFAADGDSAVMTGVDGGVYLLDYSTQSTRELVAGDGFPTAAAISPDGDRVAYTAPGEDGLVEIALTGRSGRDREIVIAFPADVVGELIWIAAE